MTNKQNELKNGQKVSNAAAFYSPIGAYFPAGSVFTVVLGGTTAGRSIKLSADRCGSVVWISDGLFLTDERAGSVCSAFITRGGK